MVYQTENFLSLFGASHWIRLSSGILKRNESSRWSSSLLRISDKITIEKTYPTLVDSKQVSFRQWTNHYTYKRFKYRQILLLKPGIHGPKSCQVVIDVFYENGGFWVQRNIFEQITHIKTGFLINILLNPLSNVLLLKVSFGEWIICEKKIVFPPINL